MKGEIGRDGKMVREHLLVGRKARTRNSLEMRYTTKFDFFE